MALRPPGGRPVGAPDPAFRTTGALAVKFRDRRCRRSGRATGFSGFPWSGSRIACVRREVGYRYCTVAYLQDFYGVGWRVAFAGEVRWAPVPYRSVLFGPFVSSPRPSGQPVTNCNLLSTFTLARLPQTPAGAANRTPPSTNTEPQSFQPQSLECARLTLDVGWVGIRRAAVCPNTPARSQPSRDVRPRRRGVTWRRGWAVFRHLEVVA